MIVKMNFLSITGPKKDIDRMTEKYLSKYEVHLVNALSELKTKENLSPFVEQNPYKNLLTDAEECIQYLPEGKEKPSAKITKEKATEVITKLHSQFSELQQQKKKLEDEREELQSSLEVIAPFRQLNIDIPTVLQYKFIKFRFGRISLDYYQKLYNYAYDNLDTIFLEGGRDDEYVWGVYFVSSSEVDGVDTIFTSLHFERIYLPDCYTSTPKVACEQLEEQIKAIHKHIEEINQKITNILMEYQDELLLSSEKIQSLSKQFDIRRLAAVTDEKHDQFYILCGWMSKESTENFLHDIKKDDNIFAIVEEDHKDHVFSKPPTKLRNLKLFKPFEMFIRMYGLPSYEEKDPTTLVALTYSFIFGAMFGDVGQGLCLAIGGFLLYKFKKMNLAAIVSLAGVFSTFFGFMFGSVFGFENIIEPIWLRPINHLTDVPFVGKLNTVFVYAIVFGMGLIILAMLLHIINAKKANDIGDMLFDKNGVSGLVFYASALAVVYLFMTGNPVPGGIVLAVMFGIPLLLIALKEPLTAKLTKVKAVSHTSAGMFVVEAFFELFETLLGYISNTLSFLRVGAFAVSHAVMMEVVLMMAGVEHGMGSPNWIVVILGNLFVMCLEGLIVGIQVLRLEYYEMFSRFYKGGGQEFEPYNSTQK